MKIFLEKLILFVSYTLFFYILFIIFSGLCLPYQLTKNLFFPINSTGFMNTRLKELKTFGKVDVLILGSSRTYRGFDTRIFERYGLKAFNLGSSAQTPMQTRILLKNYFNYLNPEWIIFEVSPGNFSSDGVESTLDLIANDEINNQIVKMVLKLKNMKAVNTLIYGLFYKITSKYHTNFEPNSKGNDKYISGGFVENRSSINIKQDIKLHSLTMRDYQKREFEEILGFLKLKNIRVVLVRAPIARYRYNQIRNNTQIDQYFQSKGIYYNSNEFIELSDSLDFADSHHLNQSGVEKFNHEIIKRLIDDSFLIK